MKHKKFLDRIILGVVAFIVIAFSLTVSRPLFFDEQIKKNTTQKQDDKGYEITFINTSTIEEFSWRDELSFNMIQLEGMSDNLAQKNVNRIIKKAATSWINGIITEAYWVNSDIYAHSNQYLSFNNVFTYFGVNRSDDVYDYITIDVINGRRVMLSDLVEINMGFVEYIRNHSVVKGSERPHEFDNDSANLFQYLQEMPPDELLKRLEGCSKTQEQILEDEDMDNYTSIGALVLRNSFYLKPGALVIVIGDNKTIKSSRDRSDTINGIHLTFPLYEISDFLKVEPWY